MSIYFIRAGLQTSIQDYGRPGLMHYGISQGGAADLLSMKLANLLLGNTLNNPVMEITLTGPLIEFDCDVSIAITGARFKTLLNNNPIENYKVIQIKSGDILEFSHLLSGARAYIGLSATISVPQILNSASTHLISGFGGHKSGAIEQGERVHLENIRIAKEAQLERELIPNYRLRPLIRVVHGAESQRFPQSALDNFFATTFQVSAQSNRMGIRLSPSIIPEPEGLEDISGEMVSSGLYPGSIQIPSNGEPIISFIEGQTIGGYPRLAHVIRADLHRLGQLKAQDKINFQLVSPAQARLILQKKNKLLAKLQNRMESEAREALTI
ncbi:biotin-dependent carboxyltransferase family protein [Microbulbifer variabilis]|uniref:5-oxoprolinase subunit C family protein n=1 Tax=Microbulbifer variabilis TaxID=266805 RepID=UPI001CFEDE2E|nr:biotin-dependent carboxyltransferase family protein [Microbulbifer variabilis]